MRFRNWCDSATFPDFPLRNRSSSLQDLGASILLLELAPLHPLLLYHRCPIYTLSGDMGHSNGRPYTKPLHRDLSHGGHNAD